MHCNKNFLYVVGTGKRCAVRCDTHYYNVFSSTAILFCVKKKGLLLSFHINETKTKEQSQQPKRETIGKATNVRRTIVSREDPSTNYGRTLKWRLQSLLELHGTPETKSTCTTCTTTHVV